MCCMTPQHANLCWCMGTSRREATPLQIGSVTTVQLTAVLPNHTPARVLLPFSLPQKPGWAVHLNA